MPTPALVELSGISKRFGTLQVLENVSLTVPPGTFHAIVGENGAGKSTLAKCLLGFHVPEAGEVRLGGNVSSGTADARRHGVGMVFQHFTLAPSMTAAENLVLARPDLSAFINWRRERTRIVEFLQHAPFQIDIDSRVEHLAAGQKQKIEILKQLYLDTSVLILDEPTSVLTPAEAGEVLGVLRSLVSRGSLSVILITHKLREVISYADEVTVLRRGRVVASKRVSETTSGELAQSMIGESRVPDELDRTGPSRSEIALELRNLAIRGDNGLTAANELSLTLHKGEILGIAGISGNGQRELIQSIGGQRELESGEMRISENAYRPSRQAIRSSGLYTLPEEPLENATVPSMSVADNLALRTFDRPSAKSTYLLDRAAIRKTAQEAIGRFNIRPPSPSTPIRNLSGGNVQRAVLARDLGEGHARIFVVANPCFGLDFAATAFVHNRLMELRNGGGSVLLVSEDLEEVLKLSDRVAVIHSGRIVYTANRGETDLEVIGRAMAGQAVDDTVGALNR